jgi:flagellar biosynthetic protein FliR
VTADDAALLASLPALAYQACLVFCRMAAASMLLPGLGEQEVPANIRLGLGLLVTLLLLPLLAPLLPPAPEAPFALLGLILGEVAIGLWLGSLARLLASAMAQAGQIIGTMMGLSSPLQGDLMLGAQGTPLGRLFGFVATALILSTGLYALPLAALLHSYTILPAGTLPAATAARSAAGSKTSVPAISGPPPGTRAPGCAAAGRRSGRPGCRRPGRPWPAGSAQWHCPCAGSTPRCRA